LNGALAVLLPPTAVQLVADVHETAGREAFVAPAGNGTACITQGDTLLAPSAVAALAAAGKHMARAASATKPVRLRFMGCCSYLRVACIPSL
jgi:hypothetical protein